MGLLRAFRMWRKYGTFRMSKVWYGTCPECGSVAPMRKDRTWGYHNAMASPFMNRCTMVGEPLDRISLVLLHRGMA